MNRRQFEYNSNLFLCRWEELHGRLNEWGLAGWEMCGIIDEPLNDPKGRHYYTCFFKREILPNGEK